MRINRNLVHSAMAALVLAGSLTFATPAQAALPSCDSTVSRQSRSNADRFGAIPSVGSSGSIDCILGVGNHSRAVGALQATLNRCFGAGLRVDNDFGQATKAALRNAQRIVGTVDDGVYGPLTRNAFNNHKRWRVEDSVARSFCDWVWL